MNRRTRHVVVLAVAVITASLASLGVYRATKTLPLATAGPKEVSVVVAARPLAIGTALTKHDVKVIAWPATSPVPGAISTVDEVVNRGLLTALQTNDLITSNKLAAAHEGSGLPPAIPPGMRAMSVKVNDVIGVAGFIVPGSRVDVVVTIRRTNDSVTSTVASNVEVLTAGTRRDQERQEKPTTTAEKPTDSTVVTLMVSPRDAERIALAQSEGQIMLALRNPLDREATVSDGVRTTGLLAQGDAAPTPVAPKPAPVRRVTASAQKEVKAEEEPKRTIETIRAAKKTEEVIK